MIGAVDSVWFWSGFPALSGSELVKLTDCEMAAAKRQDSQGLREVGADRLPDCQGSEDVKSSYLILYQKIGHLATAPAGNSYILIF